MTDIHITNVDGTGDRPLIASPADEEPLGWTPDGGSLIYNRDGDIWLAEVADGNVQTPPRLLKRAVGSIRLVGVTRHGHLYYQAMDTPAVFRAPLDATTGKVAAEPERVSFQGDVDQWTPAWSPNGRELAYKNTGPNADDAVISIVSIDTGQRRELVPDVPGGIPYAPFMSWTRDGRFLLLDGARNPEGPALKGAHLVDVLDGGTTMVISKPPNTVVVNQVKALSNGRSVVYLESWQRIVIRDLESGEERTLYDALTPRALDSLALSPDGMTVAFRDKTRRVIQAVAIAGGTPRTIAKTHEPEPGVDEFANVAWSADGRYVLFSNYAREEKRDGLWRVPIDGGTPEHLGLTTDKRIREIAVQPNGQSIVLVMSAGEAPGTRLIEKLLPAASGVPPESR